MKIQKRDGRLEQLSFDKIIYRLRKLCNDQSLGVLKTIDPDIIAQRVVSSIYDGVTSCELDEEAARIAISMTENPEYQKLASRIIISNTHKSTHECFSEVMENLYNNTDKLGKHSPIIADDVIEIIRKHKNTLNFAIDYSRDYLFDYFGYKTLERSYLQKILNKKTDKMEVVERPQHLYMRVAVGIHKDNIENILKTYDLISQHYYTHASPTLFNGGTRLNQYSSCFLLGSFDSLEGIFKTITDCGKISKLGGGIGLHVTSIRAKGSMIRGTNGKSDGIIPMIKVYNETAKYINQGGKRKGSFACFVKDTKICTVNEGIKNIQDVKIGDQVVTHMNRVRPVTQVHKNKLNNRKIYKVSIQGNNDIYVTGNHKFWSFYTKKYKSEKISYGWNSVEELKSYLENKDTKRQSCYVSIPCGTNIKNDKEYIINIQDYKNSILNDTVKELVEIDNDKIYPVSYCDYKKSTIGQIVNKSWIIDENLANLFGIWLGDGCLRKYKGYVNGITFTVHKENVKLIDYIVKNCEVIFGCRVTLSESKRSNVTQIYINSHIIGIVFQNLFGSYFDGKKLPNIVFSWPKELIVNLIAGLITTDGHISKRKKTDITLGLSNENLMIQIYHLCRNNGIKTTYPKPFGKHYTMSIKKSNELVKRILKVYDDDRMQKCLDNINENDNDRYLKITSINETDRNDEYVYTLGIEEDHSYTVEGVLVENCYLEPWHADIIEFLELKKNQGHEDMRARDLFYAVWMPDLFMKCVEEDGDWYLMCPDECPGLNDVYGDDFEKLYNKYVQEKRYKRVIKAQEIWTKILDAQIETGTPYIGYKDAVNKKCNQKNLGTIKSSNLCVAPETMILTSKGYFPIVELENKEVEVWNGEEFSTTMVKKTGQDQELIKVVLSNGSELECTPYHKFYIARGKRPSQYPRLIQVDAQNLKHGMKLIKSEYPVVKQGNSDFPYPYEHGLFCADGTYEHNSENSLLPRISLYNDKKNLVQYIQTRIEVCEEDSFGRINCRLPINIKQKYVVPINYDLNIKLRWLEGLSDGDGCIIKSDNLTGIQISSIHNKFLINVKYLLQTLGCDPKIREASEAGWKFLPDGNGGQDEYYCQKLYRLLITSYDVANLVKLGFSPKRLKVSGIYPKNNTRRWITIEKIEKTSRISDTYCFKENKRGMGIFNGVLTGQCSEISLYSDDKEYAVCNLASIALPKYVKYDETGKPSFDFEHLCQVAEYIIEPMNDVIDNNYYPVPETKLSNMRHRPIGIGVQGLVDVYVKMRFPFESEEAKRLNKEIFETIYYGCLKGSINAAKKYGHYESFPGSPFSEAKLQFDLAAEYDGIDLKNYISGRWDWNSLKKDLVKYGSRNSMLLALMPTASTAQIMGNSEAFEPVDSCIFKRRVLSGEYIVINKYLVEDLTKLGLWTKELKDTIIANDGSIQNIQEIPQDIRLLYKTVWEISMKSVIEQCRDRGVFVDQMQSMNLFMANPNYKRLTSMHFYAWKNNLKTGMYYLRSKSSYSAGKFSIDPELEKRIREKREQGEQLKQEEQEAVLMCSRENPEACMLCSS